MSRAYQTFGGNTLYPTDIEKAAALAESLIINHPFIDGNKRTGMLVMTALLLESGITFTTDENSLYSFIIKISTAEIKFDGIVAWLKQNTAAL